MTAPRVGLFGLIGSGNLGNDVSVESVLTYLRTHHPGAVVDAMCKGPETVTSRYGIPAVAMNWYQRYENSTSGGRAVLAKRAFHRSHRDAPSIAMMRQRGVDISGDHVYSDLAFGVPPLKCGPGDSQIVGVGVMEYPGDNDDQGQGAAIRAVYCTTIKAFVRWLIDNGRSVRILIADENEPEKIVRDEILADTRAHRPDPVAGRVTAHHSSTFTELMEVMALAGAIVATRYHSLICALRLGKPMILLTYAPKFAAVASRMRMSEFCQSANSPNVDLLMSQFIELERRQDELRASIAAGNAVYERSVAAQFAELSDVLFAAKDSR